MIDRFGADGVSAGDVCSLEADFSPTAIAAMLALTHLRAIQLPITSTSGVNRDFLEEVGGVEKRVVIDNSDQITLTDTQRSAEHELYGKLRSAGSPGLVLFSSGSTGVPKGAVHDLSRLLAKFHVRRHAYRTIPFLLYDHIGGVNTLLYTLSNGGCLAVVDDRSPVSIASVIEEHRVELLPTSPSFMNRFLLSEAHREHDLSSLSLVTYGTEPMPESTLARFHAELPHVRLLQTYGLSEIGILRSKSRASDSLWMQVGGEGFETRVRDGLLEIKAESAMLGYLNAPSPFTSDGWFMTGDAVEVDGDWIKVLGRVTDIINVGGEKVYPAEVESIIQQVDGVDDVSVGSIPNALLGRAVIAEIVPTQNVADLDELKRKIRQHCAKRLERYKVPARIEFVASVAYNARYKKMR